MTLSLHWPRVPHRQPQHLLFLPLLLLLLVLFQTTTFSRRCKDRFPSSIIKIKTVVICKGRPFLQASPKSCLMYLLLCVPLTSNEKYLPKKTSIEKLLLGFGTNTCTDYHRKFCIGILCNGRWKRNNVVKSH